jgi:Zn-dependent peptidase ImmA (M78 family)
MMAVTAAERILMGLGITEPKEIDLEAIAWSRGAVVEYRPLDRCDATIVGTDRRAVITVNSRSSPERRRFSIEHELGHWHHHRGRLLFCGDKDVENPADDALNPERHANEFASDLILPLYLLKPRLRKIKRLTIAAIREIGEEYSASLTAILIKIVQSNQFPVLAVCHTPKRRRWFKRADMVPGWWFPLERLDRATFAADMLFNGAAEQAFPRKMGADSWFEFRNCDRFEIQEQSFMLPGPEVLTVLTIPADGLG